MAIILGVYLNGKPKKYDPNQSYLRKKIFFFLGRMNSSLIYHTTTHDYSWMLSRAFKLLSLTHKFRAPIKNPFFHFHLVPIYSLNDCLNLFFFRLS